MEFDKWKKNKWKSLVACLFKKDINLFTDFDSTIASSKPLELHVTSIVLLNKAFNKTIFSISLSEKKILIFIGE